MVAAGRIRTNPETGVRELAEVVDLGHERGPLVARRSLSALAVATARADVVGLELQAIARRLEAEARHG